MAYYPIVSRDQKQMDGLSNRALPKNYMADFSVLGLRVADCEQALEILNEKFFEIKQGQGHTLLKIETPAHISEVIRLLNANGLACEVTDVAQGMYQG